MLFPVGKLVSIETRAARTLLLQQVAESDNLTDIHGAKNGAEFSDALRDAASQHYGPGPEFITELINHSTSLGLPARLAAIVQEFEKRGALSAPDTGNRQAKSGFTFSRSQGSRGLAAVLDHIRQVSSWTRAEALAEKDPGGRRTKKVRTPDGIPINFYCVDLEKLD